MRRKLVTWSTTGATLLLAFAAPAMAENLSAAIRGQASPLLGREDALGQARAIEALYESADGGHTVTLA